MKPSLIPIFILFIHFAVAQGTVRQVNNYKNLRVASDSIISKPGKYITYQWKNNQYVPEDTIYITYNNVGNIISQRSNSQQTVYHYDQTGKDTLAVVQEKVNGLWVNQSESISRYNLQGNLIQTDQYNLSGSNPVLTGSLRYSYVYNSQQNILDEIDMNFNFQSNKYDTTFHAIYNYSNNELISTTSFLYSNGQLIYAARDTDYVWEQNTSIKTSPYYNAQRRVSQIEQYPKSGAWADSSKITYSYPDNFGSTVITFMILKNGTYQTTSNHINLYTQYGETTLDRSENFDGKNWTIQHSDSTDYHYSGIDKLSSVFWFWDTKAAYPGYVRGDSIAYLDFWHTMPTAATKPESAALFKVYPQPAREQLNFEFPSTGSSELYLKNAIGQEIFHGNFQSTATVDVSTYTAGIYFVELISGEQTINKKIVIQ